MDTMDTVAYKECGMHSEAKERKSVKFGGVLVREHKVEMSNLPWHNGPLVTLSWNLVGEQHLDLDTFEKSRVGERRASKALLTTAEDRRELLKDHCGYSDEDLLRAEIFKRKRSIPSRTARARTFR